MSQAEMILDQVDVVKLDINLWTSSKKLRAEDLVLADGSRLPPEDLASLGTKKTIHPDKLKEFNRIKKEAERICLESGTRFIGGFANPRTEIPRITQQLDALSKEFYAARDQFLASYTADTESWINAHSEFSEAIRRAIEPVETVASKLRFDYIVFRVTKPDPEQEASLERKALSMSEQLFKEIAQDASQIIDRSFVGKDTVTGRVLKAFRRMRDKLDSLGFLDFRCMPVVDEIDSVLDSLPKAVLTTASSSITCFVSACCCPIRKRLNVMAVVYYSQLSILIMSQKKMFWMMIKSFQSLILCLSTKN